MEAARTAKDGMNTLPRIRFCLDTNARGRTAVSGRARCARVFRSNPDGECGATPPVARGAGVAAAFGSRPLEEASDLGGGRAAHGRCQRTARDGFIVLNFRADRYRRHRSNHLDWVKPTSLVGRVVAGRSPRPSRVIREVGPLPIQLRGRRPTSHFLIFLCVVRRAPGGVSFPLPAAADLLCSLPGAGRARRLSSPPRPAGLF